MEQVTKEDFRIELEKRREYDKTVIHGLNTFGRGKLAAMEAYKHLILDNAL